MEPIDFANITRALNFLEHEFENPRFSRTMLDWTKKLRREVLDTYEQGMDGQDTICSDLADQSLYRAFEEARD